MATFKDLEDSLQKYLIEEQSDAHNIKTANFAKYNNIKIYMDSKRYSVPHFFIRIAISEAVYTLADCKRLNGGLGYEEKFVIKWYGRIGIKEKLEELWAGAEKE